MLSEALEKFWCRLPRKEKEVHGSPPQKTPQDTLVSPLGTRGHLTYQLITWKKSERRADLKPKALPGELG